MSEVYHRSQSTEWSTPPRLFRELDREFGFTLDVCATADNAKCSRYFTAEEDGLLQQWEGVCWMNPPYGKTLGSWIAKAYEAGLSGATVVCLVPARTDTSWWHDLVENKAEVRFIRGRLRFGTRRPAPFPSAILVYRPRSDDWSMISEYRSALERARARIEELQEALDSTVKPATAEHTR